MWFDCSKAALENLKIAYNNNLQLFMFLPWRNSATEMFVNLTMLKFILFVKCAELFFLAFVPG